MWYVNLNGKVIPYPYQFYDDCMKECMRLKDTMIAASVYPQFIND